MKRYLLSRQALGLSLGLAIVAFCNSVSAADWSRFHGPDATGVSPDKAPLPVKWSETENLKWKVKLPGPGSSSPIVIGNRVIVTCWSGYGADPNNEGDEADLRRHVLCYERDSGKLLWDKEVKPVLPEDPYSGQFTQHGYASHTPVSDGERIYVFFGKTGALAFDLEGNKLWQTGVGTGSGMMGWGTASSPVLYKDLVIVPAFAESTALVALNKMTGKKVWKHEDRGFAGTWGTPVLVDCGQGRTDLAIAVPHKICGLNPDDGKLRWWCDGLESRSVTSSLVAHDGVVYILDTEPQGGGNIAVRAGGEGDVSKTNIVWQSSDRLRISTPVLEDKRIYFVSNKAACCLDASSGKAIYKTSLTGGPLPAQQAGGPRGGGGYGKGGGKGPGGGFGGGPGGGFGGGPGGPRGGGGRGGMGGQDYSSPVFGDGKIYFMTRAGNAFVYQAGPDFKLLAQNKFASGSGDFSATPAISDGQLFIRSSKFLYCVAQSGTLRGDNLRLDGQPQRLSRDNVPKHAIQIRVHDDESCLIDDHRALSAEEAAHWAADNNYRVNDDIVLVSDSKRSPSEKALSTLCDLAVQRNVNLYGRWSLGGGTLSISGAISAEPAEAWSLLIRKSPSP
jgi:outer membrane protein assembly factor BamB